MVVEKSEIDCAKEIIINSKLTVNKYRYFKFSLKLFIIFIFLFFSILSYEKIKINEKKENNIKIKEGSLKRLLVLQTSQVMYLKDTELKVVN